MLIFNIFVDERAYNHFNMSCVNKRPFFTYSNKSIAECKSLCSARVDCLAFEYGVQSGGIESIPKPKDCRLLNDGEKSGCNGNSWKTDLYVKLGGRFWSGNLGSGSIHSSSDIATKLGTRFPQKVIRWNIQFRFRNYRFSKNVWL